MMLMQLEQLNDVWWVIEDEDEDKNEDEDEGAEDEDENDESAVSDCLFASEILIHILFWDSCWIDWIGVDVLIRFCLLQAC